LGATKKHAGERIRDLRASGLQSPESQAQAKQPPSSRLGDARNGCVGEGDHCLGRDVAGYDEHYGASSDGIEANQAVIRKRGDANQNRTGLREFGDGGESIGQLNRSGARAYRDCHCPGLPSDGEGGNTAQGAGWAIVLTDLYETCVSAAREANQYDYASNCGPE